MKIETIRIDMKPVQEIIRRLGVDRDGDVQRQFTNMVNLRMTRYMPYKTGVLSGKSKYIKSPTEIVVLGPYAHYQYKGEVWGPNIPKKFNGMITGWWSPPVKYPTGRNLVYSKGQHGHDRAGPYWDKRMMAAEGKAIAADLQAYCARRNK